MEGLKLNFVIKGNQEDPEGNPLPKIKKTGRQQWTGPAQRYAAWKEYVKKEFWDELERLGSIFWSEFTGRRFGQLAAKPIFWANRRMEMEIKIFWANETHADPESVFGSIADALFENDKHLSGKFDYLHCGKGDPLRGQVWVDITIGEILDDHVKV